MTESCNPRSRFRFVFSQLPRRRGPLVFGSGTEHAVHRPGVRRCIKVDNSCRPAGKFCTGARPREPVAAHELSSRASAMQGSLRECADEVNEEELRERERERSGREALAAGRWRGGRPRAQSGIASASASSSAVSAVTSPRRANATWKTSGSCALKA